MITDSPNATMLTPQLVNFIERAVQCHIPIHDIDSLIMPMTCYPEPTGQYDDELITKQFIVSSVMSSSVLRQSRCQEKVSGILFI